MVSPGATLVAGLGCRRNCALDELLDLLLRGLVELGLKPSDLNALASTEHKRGEPALQQLARHLQLPLNYLPASELQNWQGQCSHASALALQVSGSFSVAEASALAQAHRLAGGPCRLLLSKRKSANATLALAISGGQP